MNWNNYRSMPQVFPRLATKPAVITHKWKAYSGAKYKCIWKTWKKQHQILQFLQAFKSRRCVWTWKRSSLDWIILANSIESKKRRKKERKPLTQLHQIPSHLHLLFLDGLETFIKKVKILDIFLHWVKAEKFKQPNPDAKFLKAHHNIDTKSKLVLYLSSTIRCLENRLCKYKIVKCQSSQRKLKFTNAILHGAFRVLYTHSLGESKLLEALALDFATNWTWLCTKRV